MTSKTLHDSLSALGRAAAHPAALFATIAFVAAWAHFQSETLDWHGAATILTLIVAILIERNATAGARDELAQLEHKDPEDAARLVEAGRNRPYYLDV